MLPTPSTSHVNYDRIYEPAEDSFLLLDTLSSPSERDFLHARFPTTSPTPLVLEVGTGSGVVLAFVTAHAQEIIGRRDAVSLGVDVNEFACAATRQTVLGAAQEFPRESGSLLGVAKGDLATCVRPHMVDVLIFNPPYVPTESLPQPPVEGAGADTPLTASQAFERDSHLLSLSYAGGIDGMETTNRLLSQIPETLSDRGVAYVLLCAQNRPAAIASDVVSWPGGWQAEVARTSGKQAGWEKLSVLRIWRG